MQRLPTMLGDVLGNPVRRPGGADRAVAVVESAASHPGRPPQVLLHADWLHWVDHPLFDHELTALYNCLNRQAPFGSSDRLAQFAGVAGLDSTLRPRGRPRKTPDKSPDPLCFPETN